MSHATRYTALGTQLQTTERMIANLGYSERVRDELKATRAEIVEERNDIWDAIMFRVPDDSEGI